MTDKQPVYCTDCRFFYRHGSDWGSNETCQHANNTEIQHRYNGVHVEYPKVPSLLNAKCDCEWYEPMEEQMKKVMSQMEAWVKAWHP